MAKKKGDAREYVWLQCSETGDLNYRTSVNVKGGLPEKMKEGIKKYSPPSAQAHPPQDQAQVSPRVRPPARAREQGRR